MYNNKYYLIGKSPYADKYFYNLDLNNKDNIKDSKKYSIKDDNEDNNIKKYNNEIIHDKNSHIMKNIDIS